MVHLLLVPHMLIFYSFPVPLRKPWGIIIVPYPPHLVFKAHIVVSVFLCSVAIGNWRNYFFLLMLTTLIFNILIFHTEYA